MLTDKKIFGIFLLNFCLLISCERLVDPDANYTYHPPDSASNEFSVSSFTEEGMDETMVTQLTNLIIREQYKRIDAMLILRNNKLVYENYFHGYSSDIEHNIFSAGKSITSILVGIAIDKGFIKSVDTPIVEMLPEYTSLKNPDPRKNEITVANLLNMSSGLDCDDSYQHTESLMQKSNDWVKFTLDLPVVHEPGSQGSYCTGCPVTLGRIIETKADYLCRILQTPICLNHSTLQRTLGILCLMEKLQVADCFS
jgi:hypothetical protein